MYVFREECYQLDILQNALESVSFGPRGMSVLSLP